MATLLTRKSQIVAKVEAVEGVAETLLAADGGLLVIDPLWEPDVAQFERAIVNPSFSKFRSLPGQRSGTISFQTEFKGFGTPGAPPFLSKYIRACAFQETINETVGSYSNLNTDDTFLPLRNGAADNIELAGSFTSAGGGETVNKVKMLSESSL